MKRAAVPSILIAVILLAVAVTGEAQQPKKVPRIGYLSTVDPATDSARAEGIRLALRPTGTVEVLVQLPCLFLLAGNRGDDKPGVFPFGQVLGLSHYTSFPGPALAGSIAKVLKHPGRLLRRLIDLLGLGHLTPNRFDQTTILGQSEHIVELAFPFAIAHDLFPTKP